jgi:two-component system CitB family sensor kinase
MRRSRRRLSTEILAWQLAILVGTGLIGSALAIHAVRARLDREYEQRALAVARSVAAMPEIASAVAAGDRSGLVQARAEAVRRATGTSFVVVTDARGIRFSHANPARIGERVSTDPSDALAGHTVLAVETGTLGRSARAKIPLRTPDGQIVGIVSVGVVEATIRRNLSTTVPIVALYAGAALALGILASLLLTRRLKRQTFGLELRELADLLQEREATLHGIREGVVAVDRDGRVRVLNDEARRLLRLSEDAVGRRVGEVIGGRLREMLDGRLDGTDLLLVSGDRVLIANRMSVRLHGNDLGAVVTLRDRTELEELVRELDSVRGLTDAMRAQSHEFSNRMQTLGGLLQLGHYEEALAFIREVSHAGDAARTAITTCVADRSVAALLVAKVAVAAERGVVLRLGEGCRQEGELTDARAVLTIVGNLVDNAIDAAREGDADPPWVEVTLRVADGTLHIRVIDSGPGVPDATRTEIFEAGYSTKPTSGRGARGVGLSLVKRMAERRGGRVTVSEAPLGGAVFEVVLPEAVRAREAVA